jgi:hypothetical protein
MLDNTYVRPYITNTKGHVWKLDEDGRVNEFAHEYEYHNGPVCVRCGYEFCHHCNDLPEKICPVTEREVNVLLDLHKTHEYIHNVTGLSMEDINDIHKKRVYNILDKIKYKQEKLPDDMQKVLDDNRWDLYEI